MTPLRLGVTGPLTLFAALLSGAALLPGMAMAQDDSDLAPQAQLSVSQQLSLDNGDLIGRIPLDLSLRTGTRSEVFGLTASVPLRLGDPEDDNNFGIGDRRAELFYRRFARQSSVEVQGRYVEADLDRLIFFDELVDDIVTLDGGRRADTGLRAGYAFGTQSKLGGEFSLGYLDRRYIDTTDPSLTDSQTVDGAATIFLEPTPLIRARILGSALETESEGTGTDTRRHRAGVGASMQVNRRVNLDLELAQSYIRREDGDTGLVEESDGLSWSGTATYLRPLGDYTLTVSSDPGTEGRRDRLRFGHSLERPTYTLSLAAGVTRLDGGDVDPTLQIAYSGELSRVSRAQLSLQRDAISDLDGNEAINTSLRGSYNRQLDEQSSVGISLFFRESEVQRGDRQDARSAAVDISYSRTLNRNISVSAGVNVVRSREGDGLRENDERVYVGLGRSFNFLR